MTSCHRAFNNSPNARVLIGVGGQRKASPSRVVEVVLVLASCLDHEGLGAAIRKKALPDVISGQ